MVHNFRGRILTMSVQLLKPTGLHLMTSRTDTAVKKMAGFLGTASLPEVSSIPFLPLSCLLNRLRRFWHGFQPSARREGFILCLGCLESKKNETVMVPNHPLLRTQPLRCGWNPPSSWTESLSLGRWRAMRRNKTAKWPTLRASAAVKDEEEV
jgi:hypothetical protein